MKKYFFLSVALSPLALFALAILANYALGCTGNVGPGGNHCRHASDSFGSALVGFMYVGAFGWLVTVPIAILLAIVLKLISKSAARETK